MADQKLVAQLEHTSGENKFVYLMPVGVPLQQAYDATVEFQKTIIEWSENNKKQAEQSTVKTEDKPLEAEIS